MPDIDDYDDTGADSGFHDAAFDDPDNEDDLDDLEEEDDDEADEDEDE